MKLNRFSLAVSIILWAMAASLIVSLALVVGIHRPFTQLWDCDVHYAYNALRFNTGQTQRFFDHPQYGYSLVLSWWLKLAHLAGGVPARLTDLGTEPGQMIQAFARTIFAGRVLSVVVALTVVAGIVAWTRRLSGDLVLASLLGLVLAASDGINYHTIALRPEAISSLASLSALACLLCTAGRPLPHAGLWLAAATACSVIAVLCKLQAIIPLAMMPVVALAIEGPAPSGRRFFPAALMLMTALGALLVLPVLTDAWIGVEKRQDREGIPFYTLALGIYIALGVTAYVIRHRLGAAGPAVAFISLAGGLAGGWLFTLFHRDLMNLGTAVGFLDALKVYSPVHDASFEGSHDYTRLLGAVAEQVGTVARLVLAPGQWNPPRVLPYLLAVSLAAWLAANGRRRQALEVAAVLSVALAEEVLFRLRALPPWYEIFVVPVALLAVATGWRYLDRSERRPAMAACGLAVAIAVGTAVSDSHARFGGTAYVTPHFDAASFCQGQLDWSPVLPAELYKNGRCWPYYRAALPERLPFPVPGEAPSVKAQPGD